MWEALELGGVAVHPEIVRQLLVRLVHHYHRDTPVRVEEGGRQQRAAARRARDPFGARAREFRDVTDVVVRVCVNQLAASRIRVYGREAEVLHVIRTTRFVQQHVPIGPTHGAAVEVIDHRTSI
jgi:hypothetical protein